MVVTVVPQSLILRPLFLIYLLMICSSLQKNNYINHADDNIFYACNKNIEHIMKDLSQDRISHRRCSIKKGVLKIQRNSRENNCPRVSILIKLQFLACNFIKKEALAQVLSCAICGIFKNTFLQNTSGQMLLTRL